ncbi:RNA polymerase II mediator complex subunit [Gnomoniopsis smithogilvyi]|uniref:Mediator of RNA polymerase II transcription subunit 10 n=1 Tax=Gnomoniopsis smithogilvyi TaxID=1191159 RepID=A0A9W8YRN3_9PEZI|nr:RNA polymerase II mediator complex subunit [Gnomoniopsis smithogilvyi]
MAPIEPDHNAVERQLKQVIQILYETMIQVNTYDAHTVPAATTNSTNGTSTPPTRPTRDVLAAQLTQLSNALQDIHRLAGDAQASGTLADIPRELILYVDNGRNPDIYTREFVELVRRENQLMRGKMRAFAGFRDILGREIANANPELREDVARVVVGTGGEWPPKSEAGQ